MTQDEIGYTFLPERFHFAECGGSKVKSSQASPAPTTTELTTTHAPTMIELTTTQTQQ
jgi:hypothetical protein